eukprot:GHVH01004521.1.p1 GENE.GHVH01004521.1~~GHVH01004521.1.p1  ORF type:complete len:718 (+),score=112.21 GHVH01004521.1:215-2368(+)
MPISSGATPYGAQQMSLWTQAGRRQGSQEDWSQEQILELEAFIRERRPELSAKEVAEFREGIVMMKQNASVATTIRRPSTGPGAIGGAPKTETSLWNPNQESRIPFGSGSRPDKGENSLPNDSLSDRMLKEEHEALKRRVRTMQVDFTQQNKCSQEKVAVLENEKQQIIEMNQSLQKQYRAYIDQYDTEKSRLKSKIDELMEDKKKMRNEIIELAKGGREIIELKTQLNAVQMAEKKIISDNSSHIEMLTSQIDVLQSSNRQSRMAIAATKSQLDSAYERIEKLTSQLQMQKDNFNKEALAQADQKLLRERDTLARENDKLECELRRVKDVYSTYKAEKDKKINEVERALWSHEANAREKKSMANTVEEYHHVILRHFPDGVSTDPNTLDILLSKVFQFHSQQVKLKAQPPPLSEHSSPESSHTKQHAKLTTANERLKLHCKQLEQEIKSYKRTVELLMAKQAGIEPPAISSDCSSCLENRDKLIQLASLQEEARHLNSLKMDVEYEKGRVRVAHSLNKQLNEETETLIKNHARTQLEMAAEIDSLKGKLDSRGVIPQTEDIENMRKAYQEDIKLLRQIVACFLGWEICYNRLDDYVSNDNSDDDDTISFRLRSVYVEPNLEGSLEFSNITEAWMGCIMLGNPISDDMNRPSVMLNGVYKERYSSDSDTSVLLRNYKVSSSDDWYPHFMALINIDDYTKRISRKAAPGKGKIAQQSN